MQRNLLKPWVCITPMVTLSLSFFACGGGGSGNNNDEPGLGELVFSEIMYNAGGTDTLEYVELYNGTDTAISMANLILAGGVDYQFSANAPVLESGDYLVLTGDTAAFRDRYGESAYGPWTGNLDNSGESLKLKDSTGDEIISMEYSNDPPWPGMADGGGYSLVFVGDDQNSGTSWLASSETGGSPGSKNSAADEITVRVNEVLPGGNSDGGWVELYNSSSESVDIGGWWLTDDIESGAQLTIPSGTSISGNGYVVFAEADWGTSFYPSMTGESVYLVKANTGSSSGLVYPALDSGISAGVITLTDGSLTMGPLASTSSGATNGTAKVGPLAFSEIMYHPADGGYEYLEIQNLTDEAITLSDASDAQKTWKVTGVDFSFPTGAEIAANGKVVLVSKDDADTAVFRSAKAVPDSVPVYGYDGKLSNSGETIIIKQPLIQVAKSDGSTDYANAWSDVAAYSDSDPWPSSPDGDGSSLTRVDFTLSGSDAEAWDAGDQTPGR
ncbi:MAG TPA: lamin tail domain-containing protein [Fibrobacteraceae bacterium]|nr:lamin tail domain-containing protein [Fibrobacteraceae bacterium]